MHATYARRGICDVRRNDVTRILWRNSSISELRNRSALAVNCCVIIHSLEVSCKEDQITSAQRE